MARTSANSVKRKVNSPLQDKPREGTNLRTAYDRLMTGKPIKLDDIYPTNESRTSATQQLRETYELELRTVRDETIDRTVGASIKLWQCIGMWDGFDYRTVEDVQVALDNSVLRTNKGVNGG